MVCKIKKTFFLCCTEYRVQSFLSTAYLHSLQQKGHIKDFLLGKWKTLVYSRVLFFILTMTLDMHYLLMFFLGFFG